MANVLKQINSAVLGGLRTRLYLIYETFYWSWWRALAGGDPCAVAYLDHD